MNMNIAESYISAYRETMQFHSLDTSEDDDSSFESGTLKDYDSSDLSCGESCNELVSAEKVYVCDYDKIYICLYEDIEEYRISKQSNGKKKNTLALSSWNNLPVVLPTGSLANIKSAPDIIFKDVKKVKAKEEPKTENFVKPKPIITTNDHNSKSELPKQIKPEKLSKRKLKKQRQKEKKETQKQKKADKHKELGQKLEDGNKTDSNGKIVQESTEVFPKEEDEVSLDNKSRPSSKLENIEFAENFIDKESEENDEAAEDFNLLDEMPAFVSNALKNKEKKDSAKTKKNIEHKEEKHKKPKAKQISIKEDISTKKETAKTKPILIKEDINTKKETPKTKPILIKADINTKKENAKPKPIPVPVLPSTSGQGAINKDPPIMMKKSKPTQNEYKESISLGKEAIKQLMDNKVLKAVEFLDEAIHLNPHDLRHFLNRSFCYLRLGSNSLALKDAEAVINMTNDNNLLVTAKFRAGQAFCGLQNFKEAEKYLDEAYNFSQANSIIHQQLLRVKILQLLGMGFREKDVLKALKECPSVEGVVSLLSEKTITEDDDDGYYKNQGSEDDIYNSDDEENPSLARMFINLSSYQQGFVKKAHNTPLSSSKMVTINPQQQKITTPVNPKIPAKDVNDKAIWVGNTGHHITDMMLRQRFTNFGKIISIYRKSNENYTFINFESAKSVMALLHSHSFIDVEGHKLPIKFATRIK